MGTLHVLTDELTESNCYCVEEDGRVLVIDPNDETVMETAFGQYGWIPEMVLLTHEHCDHMRGLNWLREHFPVTVVSTKACSENLKDTKKNMSKLMGMYLYFRNGWKPAAEYPRIQCEPADIVFEHTWELDWRGHHFFLEAIPGHTEGSCSIRMDGENVFCGDYMIAGEEDILRFPGGSKEDYGKWAKPWMERIKSEPKIHLYPGHGTDYWLEAGKEVHR